MEDEREEREEEPAGDERVEERDEDEPQPWAKFSTGRDPDE